MDEYEQKVLKAMEPDYDYLVLIIPSLAEVSDFAAADALAKLKKKGLVKFEGRGRFRSLYLTPEGVAARAAL